MREPIVTDTQAHANQLVAQINGGAIVRLVAKANSLDTQTAANGGALGCNYTLARRWSRPCRSQSVAVGHPSRRCRTRASGQWLIYEVTSQTVAPLSQPPRWPGGSSCSRLANVNRVSKEIVAFAHTADVSVNPQYGTWNGLTVVPPVGPPAQFLLARLADGSTPLVKRTPRDASGISQRRLTPDCDAG